ncbi:YihY/virulence factor BrkB family protein [Xylanibacter muris]|uniref:YihY/virulence factor BrkB family protein n=1 Tax=Xylanibacter muris TaxID=2736290 RepID=A0ABX2AN04_9BACT|nr:YihY/virulence factor BrkB family protein [Xylanibacter muris]NPD92308.1 YihY/virulence factor BrkB family protein [Xylanibacter muris]
MKKKIESIKRFIQVDIWAISSKDVSPFRYFLLDVLKKLILAVRFFTTKRVLNSAAALTYSTLLAIVPIFAVVFAIARGFGYNKYIEMWFRDAFQSQPQAADVIIGFVNSYLVHTKSGVFLGIGLVFMVYTVLMLVSNVESVFNGIWQVKKQRSIFRTFTDYMAMFVLFPIIIVVTSGVSIFVATVADRLPDVILLGPAVRFLIDLIPYVFMSAMFIGLYVFMPNTHVQLRSAVVPGILAGVAMQGLQFFYIHSQMWVSGYNAIYGSFAALPLFMLWVQISWTICLFGAELCYTNQHLDYYDYSMNTGNISHRYRLLLCAMIMGAVCRRFDKGGNPYTAFEVSGVVGIPIRIVNDLMYDLIDAELLIEIVSDEKGELSRFVPYENTSNLSVGVMVARLESVGKWNISLPLDNCKSQAFMKALDLRGSYLKASRKILLKDF